MRVNQMFLAAGVIALGATGAWAGTVFGQLKDQAQDTSDGVTLEQVTGVSLADSAEKAAATKLVMVDEPGDAAVADIVRMFKAVFSKTNTGRLRGYVHTAYVGNRSIPAPLQIKQMVHAVFTGNSKREEVDVQVVLENNAGIRDAVDHSLAELLSGRDEEDRITRVIGDAAYDEIHRSRYIRVFKGSRSNSFGTNSFLALYSTRTQEITLIGTSYAE